MEIPVPIPNTEVKHSNVENSGSEDRKLPFFFALDEKNIYIIYKKVLIICLLLLINVSKYNIMKMKCVEERKQKNDK